MLVEMSSMSLLKRRACCRWVWWHWEAKGHHDRVTSRQRLFVPVRVGASQTSECQVDFRQQQVVRHPVHLVAEQLSAVHGLLADLALKYEELLIISRHKAYEGVPDLDESSKYGPKDFRSFDYAQGNGGGGCASNKPLNETQSLVYAKIQIGGLNTVPEQKSKQAKSG
ncbi:hypothetical protein BASA82_000131 [Batrachochytrium salamandrivorans]|nr:hypothetical protein BASA82_000131 [Batrachochytrium salamandrivorans]